MTRVGRCQREGRYSVKVYMVIGYEQCYECSGVYPHTEKVFLKRSDAEILMKNKEKEFTEMDIIEIEVV